jgi:hypothetical protein
LLSIQLVLRAFSLSGGVFQLRSLNHGNAQEAAKRRRQNPESATVGFATIAHVSTRVVIVAQSVVAAT